MLDAQTYKPKQQCHPVKHHEFIKGPQNLMIRFFKLTGHRLTTSITVSKNTWGFNVNCCYETSTWCHFASVPICHFQNNPKLAEKEETLADHKNSRLVEAAHNSEIEIILRALSSCNKPTLPSYTSGRRFHTGLISRKNLGQLSAGTLNDQSLARRKNGKRQQHHNPELHVEPLLARKDEEMGYDCWKKRGRPAMYFIKRDLTYTHEIPQKIRGSQVVILCHVDFFGMYAHVH